MPTSNSRRARIAAIAATGDYNPAEAAVAQAMLDRLPATLSDIAAQIKAEWGKGNAAMLVIGRLLSEARASFGEGDRSFGHWFKGQDFPFGQQGAWRLRYAAEHEPEVQVLLAQPKPGGKERSVDNAVRILTAKPRVEADVGATDAVNPAFALLRAAFNRILGVTDGEATGNAFRTMHVDDLALSATYIMALATAYSEARTERTAHD
jgi:hypothetical protein